MFDFADLLQRLYALTASITFTILIYANRKNLSYLHLLKLAGDAVFWPILVWEECYLFFFRKNIVVIHFEDIENRS